MMRPLGRPPTPSARSTASEPVVSVSTFILALSPKRMIEPSPNCLVMEERASSMFLSRAELAAARTAAFAEPLAWAAGFDSGFTGAGAALDMAGVDFRTVAIASERRGEGWRSKPALSPNLGVRKDCQID